MSSNVVSSASLAVAPEDTSAGRTIDLNYHVATQLLAKERVVVNLEAPGWVVIMFFCWSKFIQKTTGFAVKVRVVEDA